ncbi:MAG: PadR family transcriptional regulator [Candidatus Sigynarchaeum springense]
MLLLNTIKKRTSQAGGMPYAELQKIENLPHIKVYRTLKRMEENHLLEKKEERIELGRPRQLYRLSSMGEQQLEQLKTHMLSFFDIIRRSFPDKLYESFDAPKFVEEGTFDTFCFPPPPSRLMDDEGMSDEERLEMLSEIKAHMEKRLQHVSKEISELQAKVMQKKHARVE